MSRLIDLFDPSAINNTELSISVFVVLLFVFSLFLCWRNRHALESGAMALTSIVIILWASCHALSILVVNFALKQAFLNTQFYIGLLVPVTVTFAVLLFTRQAARLRVWVLVGQSTLALILLGLLVTNSQHTWMIQGYAPQTINGSLTLVPQRGPLLTFHLIYGFVTLISCVILVLRHAGLQHVATLRHSLPLLVGVIAPLFGYFVVMSRNELVRPFTLLMTTMFLVGSAVATWLYITMRDIRPVARNVAFDNMSQAVVVIDTRQHIVDINNTAQRIIGKPLDKIQNHPIYDLRDDWRELVQYCLSLPQPGHLSVYGNHEIIGEVARWGGWEQRFFESRATKLSNQRSELTGWSIVLTDITEQKRNTGVLVDEKRRLQLLYSLSFQLNGILTPTEVATHAVEQIVAALNLYMAELLLLEPDGEHLRVLAVSGQSNQTIVEINRTVNLRVGVGLAGAAAANRQMTIWTDLGSAQRWYESVGLDVTIKAGAAVPLLAGDTLIGVLTLLSDRKDGFQEHDRPLFNAVALPIALALNNALRFDEAQRRSIFFEKLTALSTQLRMITRHADVLQTLSEHSLRYFKADMVHVALPTEDGQNLQLTSLTSDGSDFNTAPVPIQNSLLGRLFRTGESHLSPNVLQDSSVNRKNFARFMKSLNEPATLCALHAPLRTAKNVMGLLIVLSTRGDAYNLDDLNTLTAFADVGASALRRAEILETLEQRVTERTYELAEANKQLAELDQLKNEFIASVNHELRTPLTNIKLYLSLLADGKEERRARYMEVLQRETNHLARLLDTSLDIAKLEQNRVSGSQQMNLFDLREAVHQAYDSHVPIAKAKQLNLRLGLPDSPVYVYGNQMQLAKAFSNLLVNAIDYTQEGIVTIELSWHEKSACIVVTDQGFGISEYEYDKIWKRFYRGKKVRQTARPGYGLGLSIVKEIVDMHHGSVNVHSQESIGSTFEITLPVMGKASPTFTSINNENLTGEDLNNENLNGENLNGDSQSKFVAEKIY